MSDKIKSNLSIVIEELENLKVELSEIENTPVVDVHNEILRIRRNINELVISELVLLLEDGENHEREKVES